MEYLNLSLNFFEHPKFVRLRRELGKHSELYVLRLWIYTAKFHCTDGILKGYGTTDLLSIVGETEEKIVETILKFGFVKRIKNGFEVVDFMQHNGHLKMQKERARKAAAARWGNNYEPENPDAQAYGKHNAQALGKHMLSSSLTIPTKDQGSFTKHETEMLEKKLLEKTGYVKGSMALGVRIQELWLKARSKKSPIAYALTIIENEKSTTVK